MFRAVLALTIALSLSSVVQAATLAEAEEKLSAGGLVNAKAAEEIAFAVWNRHVGKRYDADVEIPQAFEIYSRIGGIGSYQAEQPIAMAETPAALANPSLRARLLIIAASSAFASGDLAQARALIQKASSGAQLRAQVREELTLADARTSFFSEPARITASLRSMLADASVATSVRIDALRLIGRAELASGNFQTAVNTIKAAIAASLESPGTGQATSRLIGDLALAHGLGGRRDLASVAAGAATGNFAAPFELIEIAPFLPICGEGGIRIDDTLVLEIVRTWGAALWHVEVVFASRPEIVATFLNDLAPALHMILGDRSMPPVSVQVRCVQGVNSETVFDPVDTRGAIGGIIQRSQFVVPIDPKLGNKEAGFENAVELATRIFGTESLETALLLVELASELQRNAPEVAAAHRQRAIDILASNGEKRVAAVIRLVNEEAAFLIDPFSHNFADVKSRYDTEGGDAYGSAALRVAFAANRHLQSFGEREALLREAIKLLSSQSGIKAERLRLISNHRLAELLAKQGRQTEANTLALSGGLPRNLCALRDAGTGKLVRHTIDADSYPPDAKAAGLAGFTSEEYGLDATGRVNQRRIVLSRPPMIFDATTEPELPEMEFDPAKFGGNASPCVGKLQPFRWQMPGR